MRPPARARVTTILRAAAGALSLLAALGAAGSSQAATLVINVQTPDGHVLPGAVVTVRPLDGAPRKPAPVHAIIDQVNRAFEPDILVIPVGSTVEFPNSDSVSHQIYSFSPTKRFQLPLYHGKPYPPVHFDEAGIVTLGCNIHDKMVGYILVTDATFFGRTDARGVWSVPDLPRGTYHVSLWHPLLREPAAALDRAVSITGDEAENLTVQLAQSLRPAPLQPSARSKDQY